VIYFPIFDDADIPTKDCQHLIGEKIGGIFCRNTCPHLVFVINRGFQILIDCNYSEKEG
jgi:hypothetical protein